jgi:Holliday junction DNA helicase RuvA
MVLAAILCLSKGVCLIYYLSGKLTKKEIHYVVIDIHGIGYKVAIAFSDFEKISDIGSQIKLFIHHHLRENEETLWGFLEEKSLAMFELLISISGVGPKAAITILSRAKSMEIEDAILQSNSSFFSSIPGIGTKTANRIIIDLKSKISPSDLAKISQTGEKNIEIIDALISLGYQKKDAMLAVQNIPKNAQSSEEKIKAALGFFNKK